MTMTPWVQKVTLTTHMTSSVGWFGAVAGFLALATLVHAELRGVQIQLVSIAIGALVVLFVATTLSVYKPRGVTRYGRRKQQEERGIA